MNLLQRLPISGWTLFCYAMIALASLTGSFITLLGFLGGVVAFVSLLRNPPETLPKEGVWLSLTFAGYFAVLAITTTLNGPDPERFIEFVIISPFIYFIPLALILPVRCTDISLKGLGRAAMIGSVPTAILAFAVGTFMTGGSPLLIGINPNVLAAILLMQTFLCLSGWTEIRVRERMLALLCFIIGFVGLVFGVGSRGAALAAVVLVIACVFFWSSTQSLRIQRLILAGLSSVITAAALIALYTFYGDLAAVWAKVQDPAFGDWSSGDGIRLTLYRAAIPAIIDHPWTGLGQHMRYDGVAIYFVVPPPDGPGYAFTHMHNLLLTHGTAAGIPGILAALSLFGVTLLISLRSTQPSKIVRWLGVMCTLSLFLLGAAETVLFQDLNTTFYMFLFILVTVFAHQAGSRTTAQ